MSYYAAKVLGQVFANPPFYVLRCLVATESGVVTQVVKGKIAGPVDRGFVFTFKGKKAYDGQGRESLEVERNPIDPKWLRGSASTEWASWADPSMLPSLELLATLSESGANTAVLNSLWRDISANPGLISKDPWYLVQKGLSFKVADTIASRLLGDFSPTCTERVGASLLWSVKQASTNGHCYLDAQTVFKDAQILTGVSDPKDIATQVKSLVAQGALAVDKSEDGNGIYLPSFLKMELEVAGYLKSPHRRVHEGVVISDEFVVGHAIYPLTDDQIRAVKLGLTEPVSIVTGLPGTGKTTILNTLCKALRARSEQLLLVAPTGIAAKRLASLTGLDAVTIHRAFGAGMPDDSDKPKSDYEGIKKDEDPLSDLNVESDRHSEHWKYHPNLTRGESVVIIDEASMVDLHLMWRLLRGISPSCRVVMVGDTAQLPPVGAGFALQEIINANVLPRIHLSQIFRQGEGSGVVKAAHNIYKGQIPVSDDSEYVFHQTPNQYDALELLLEKCKELHFDGVDFHVMSPTHHGTLGVTNLNRELRTLLNPFSAGQKSLKIGTDELRVGDRVMVTRNEYTLDVFNGDIGTIHHIGNNDVEIILKGTNAQLVSLPKDKVGNLLRLAYATTVHKAQGQEYDTILMPLTFDFGANLLQRSLFYTAVTRAKKCAHIYGDIDAVSVAVANKSSGNMLCRLKSRF
jgi:exodeoxyribonuclease V alpha subunit